MMPTVATFCEDNAAATYCEEFGSQRRERPISHYKDAIADFLFELTRWLDIRPLWRRGETRFFRVNFWKSDVEVGEERIARSIFLAVEDTHDGLCVREAA